MAVLGLRRIVGALPPDEGRLARVSDNPRIALAWVRTNVGFLLPGYLSIYQVVREQGAVKGAPGAEKVRTGEGVATLRRWQGNRKLRELAQAEYPQTPPEQAVKRWYEHGGTMQPLRWSWPQVQRFAAALEVDTLMTARPGEALTFIGPPVARGGRRW